MTGNFIERAQKFNSTLTQLISATKEAFPVITQTAITATAGDAAQCRKAIGELTKVIEFSPAKDWVPGMTTNPGDAVKDPLGEYTYIYGGKEPMTHTNPTFYPGAEGVYYWHIVPKTLNGYKVYPDIPGIVVAVKHGEIWWDTYEDEMFVWKGADNPNCVWPPIEGNEWDAIKEVIE